MPANSTTEYQTGATNLLQYAMVSYNICMKNSLNILVIEDDADINDVIATYLRRHGFCCTQAFSGSEARFVLQERKESKADPFDLVITDLMLPGLPGRNLVELIRAEGDTPVIVTSALADSSSKVDLLSIGADDYLVKPFDLDELLARVHVQLRHKDWIADVAARTLIAAGNSITLTRLEFNIIEALVHHPKKAFTKRELFEAAWQEECFIEEKAINVHMSNIRAKLKASGTHHYIETVWGIGFKLAE